MKNYNELTHQEKYNLLNEILTDLDLPFIVSKSIEPNKDLFNYIDGFNKISKNFNFLDVLLDSHIIMSYELDEWADDNYDCDCTDEMDEAELDKVDDIIFSLKNNLANELNDEEKITLNKIIKHIESV